MIEAGTKLPSLNLLDASGELVTSRDIVGRWTILFFYPKDNTPG